MKDFQMVIQFKEVHLEIVSFSDSPPTKMQLKTLILLEPANA